MWCYESSKGSSYSEPGGEQDIEGKVTPKKRPTEGGKDTSKARNDSANALQRYLENLKTLPGPEFMFSSEIEERLT